MRVSERAYTLLKSEAHGEAIEDWIASRRGGPDMALVFEAANGASLDTVRVPAFFTYQGFYRALLDHMPTIAEKMQKEQWVLGPSGDQSAVKQQYASMMPDIIDLYGKEFVAAWNVALGNLALAPAGRRQAEISRAQRRFGADFADQTDLRIDSRRDLADARAKGAGGERPGRGCGGDRRADGCRAASARPAPRPSCWR